MRVASGARHELAYIKETTSGTPPTNPQMTSLRHTSCSLNLSRDNFQSNELRRDRMIADVRTGTDKVSGSIDFELRFQEFAPLLEAALCGKFDASSDIASCGTDETSFSMQRDFGNGTYGVYRGCYINSLSLSIKPNAMVTGSFGVVGLSGGLVDAPLCAAPTLIASPRPYDTYTGALTIDSSPIAVVTGLDISLENGIEPQFVVLEKSAPFVSFGRSNLSGTLTAFFADRSLVDLFVTETASKLEMVLGNGTRESYKLTLPRVIYTGADVPASGEGPIVLSMPFMAVLDDTNGTNFMIQSIPGTVTTSLSESDY